ncbi:hypothetical protein JM949_15320, partial [Micromonospora sp. STR1s_6]|nr:hypothetical protein [Micromonospora tarensis]
LLGLGRALAVTGRLAEARRRRAEAITAAESVGDARLIGEVLAGFDVPASWPRNDDESLSAHIVRAAEHALTALGRSDPAQRSRLLSTLALELRGSTTDRGRRAAEEAETIARSLDDPGLVAFALNARFMHAFDRVGLAGARARIGADLVDLAARHQLATFEVLGHLVLVQANCALADRPGADAHARAADRLAHRYELPLVGVFTRWYAALRLALDGDSAAAADAYRAADGQLGAEGMPGLTRGLLPLALIGLWLADTIGGDRPIPGPAAVDWADLDWGPHEPWVRPLLLLAAGDPDAAAAALRTVPEGPHDLLREVRLCLVGRAAWALDDRATMARVQAELLPAVDEMAAAAGCSPPVRWPGTSPTWPVRSAVPRSPPGTAVRPGRSPPAPSPPDRRRTTCRFPPEPAGG